MLRVLHLVGSAESDFYCDLSRLYAADCLTATADPSRYWFHIAYVTPDGSWRFPADLSDTAIAAALPLAVDRIIGPGHNLLGIVLAAVVIGAVIIARLHGRFDGWRLAIVALGLFVLYSLAR